MALASRRPAGSVIVGEGLPDIAVRGGHDSRHGIDLTRGHRACRRRIENLSIAERTPQRVCACKRSGCVQQIGEVGVATAYLLGRGHPDPALQHALVNLRAFVIGEPEGLVPDDPASGNCAELVLPQFRFALGGRV